MNEKPKKSSQELHQLILEKLRQSNEPEAAIPTEPYFHELDLDGCNWDISIWKGDSEASIKTKLYLQDFVKSLRQKYDIAIDI